MPWGHPCTRRGRTWEEDIHDTHSGKPVFVSMATLRARPSKLRNDPCNVNPAYSGCVSHLRMARRRVKKTRFNARRHEIVNLFVEMSNMHVLLYELHLLRLSNKSIAFNDFKRIYFLLKFFSNARMVYKKNS